MSKYSRELTNLEGLLTLAVLALLIAVVKGCVQ